MMVYRADQALIKIELAEHSRFMQSLLNEDMVQCAFSRAHYYHFQMGDYILHRGKKYTLLSEPEVNKISALHYDYRLRFESDQYKLRDVLFMLDNKSEFFLYADAKKLLELLIKNLKRVLGEAYQVGSCPSTATKHLRFSDENSLYVLQRICKEFDLEFEFAKNKISLAKSIGKDTGLVLKFKQGLRGIERIAYEGEGLITRLYPYGGKKNIISSYRHGAERLQMEELFLEKNTEQFGIIEAVKTFEEIYPHREGKVTAIDPKDPLIFNDETLDFDINEQLIPGTTPKVTFNSGALSGYELEIHAYNVIRKEFDLIAYQDEKGYRMPNENFKIKVGDQYVLHDMIMPDAYIKEAERKLKEKALEYLDRYASPNLIYNITPDYVYLRRNLIELKIGDFITIEDEDFHIKLKTRVISLSQSLLNAYEYQIRIGNEANISYFTAILKDQKVLNHKIQSESIERAKHDNRNRKNLGELKRKVFDPDGYFDTKNIKPFSIETGMLSVGMKGQQFIIEDLLIEPNYLGNKDVARFGEGTLVHFTIADEVRRWILPALIVDLSDDEQAYYLYARCSKEGQGGVFFVSKEQFKTQGDTRDYYFLLGVIHSVKEGVRGVSLTYGQTTVNGRFITTGRIKSVDGYNFIDLDGNQFAIGNGQSGLDWNVSEKDTLTVKGAIIQKGQVADWVIDEGKITSKDKAATLDSKEGKFSISSNLGDDARTEISKDGVYSGHAGINLKVDDKEVKAAVVGQRGSDAPNAFGGVFQGILAQGLHLGVKTIKDEDLIQTESYTRNLCSGIGARRLHNFTAGYVYLIEETDIIKDEIKHWRKIGSDKWGFLDKFGYITAPEDGWFDVSAIWGRAYVKDPKKPEMKFPNPPDKIGLYVDDKLVRELRCQDLEVLKEDKGQDGSIFYYYRIHEKGISIEKGQPFCFKDIDGPRLIPAPWVSFLKDLTIYFKSKEDKINKYYYTTEMNETFISVETSRDFALHLPKKPHQGRTLIIKSFQKFNIHGNGNRIRTNKIQDDIDLSHGEPRILIFDGASNWMSLI